MISQRTHFIAYGSAYFQSITSLCNFQSSQRFFDKTGFHELPQVILNGVPIDSEEVSELQQILLHG